MALSVFLLYFHKMCIFFFPLLVPHRKNSPSLQNANNSNHGDPWTWRPRRRPTQFFLATQQVVLLFQALFINSSECNRKQRELRFLLCMTSFSFVLRPFHFSIRLRSNIKPDLTLLKNHIGIVFLFGKVE